jgi:hypothetical protein
MFIARLLLGAATRRDLPIRDGELRLSRWTNARSE